jgi:hypothetical protein
MRTSFGILTGRLSRGTTPSRIMSMGYQIADEDVDVAEAVFEMHL